MFSIHSDDTKYSESKTKIAKALPNIFQTKHYTFPKTNTVVDFNTTVI